MKVSLSPHSVSGKNAVQRLPLPFVRLVAPRGSPKHFVSAFGSWILAMHPRDPVSDKSESYFPMLNVVSQGITFGPGHGQGHSTNRIYLSVGEKLFTLSTTSIEMLCLKENVFPPAVYCSSMDCSLKWSRKKLARPPFKVDDVISYALQPDQQTFLVSTNKDGAAATFTFDTVALSWKLLGNWALPFDGRGHFDPYLQSFVGISKDPNTLGQLYMCGLPIGNTGEGQCPAPVKKLFREKLFSQDPAERHVSATLIYMGYQSKFCLVQCLSIEEDSTDQALVKEGDVRLPGRCLYRVTTFFFSGDLKIKDRQVQYYEVPKATTKCFLFEDPVAFWM